jgi:hypothetical protein
MFGCEVLYCGVLTSPMTTTAQSGNAATPRTASVGALMVVTTAQFLAPDCGIAPVSNTFTEW